LDEKVVSLKNLTHETRKFYESSVYCDKNVEMNYHKVSYDFAIDNLKRPLKKYDSEEPLMYGRDAVYKKHYDKYGRRNCGSLNSGYIQYVRYLNDFLIGIVGSREYARQIRKDLNNFIKSNLHLEVKKDNLVSRNDGPIKFLGHFLGLNEFKVKTSVIPKSIRAVMKNKNKSISKFLESDKRLARAKSKQFYSNVLKQLYALSSEFKISITNKPRVEVLASILAYKGLGSHLLKTLSLDNWEQFNKLLCSIDSQKLFLEKTNNSALSRWSSYLQMESDRLREFSAEILNDNIASQVTFYGRHASLFQGQADKVKHPMKNYFNKVEDIIKESLNLKVEKKLNKIISKHKTHINSKAGLSQEDKNLL
jgi:hypothetical protein